MRDISDPSEMELIKDMQEALADAKRAQDKVIKKAARLMKVMEGVDLHTYHKVFGFKAAMMKARAELEVAHAVGTAAMCDCYDEPVAGPVVFGGGGR